MVSGLKVGAIIERENDEGQMEQRKVTMVTTKVTSLGTTVSNVVDVPVSE